MYEGIRKKEGIREVRCNRSACDNFCIYGFLRERPEGAGRNAFGDRARAGDARKRNDTGRDGDTGCERRAEACDVDAHADALGGACEGLNVVCSAL